MERGTLGVTLIELLVVISIFGLVLGFIATFFVGQSRAADIQKAHNEGNEAIRIALSLVTWDLQNAGYRVPVTNSNPAIQITSDNVGGHRDTFLTRFFDDSRDQAQRVRYDIHGDPGMLRRAQFPDDPDATAAQAPTVAEIIAMNVVFETRPQQFVDEDEAASRCPDGSAEIGDGSRHECLWVWKDVPERLIRQVRIELLARSDRRISGHNDSRGTYEFTDLRSATDLTDLDTAGTTELATEPGFVYVYSEQTVSTPNLGR